MFVFRFNFSIFVKKMNMKEVFKDIKGYEGIYQISNLGNVKSIRRNKLLKVAKDRCGYLKTVFSINNIRKTYLIHRLVAETFITNPDNLPCVNHKDEDKSNNCVDNLEWCSYLYNNTYGNRIDKCKTTRCKTILQLDLKGNIIKEWFSAAEIQRHLGYSHERISKTAQHKYGHKTAYGYKWEYKEVS